jgi:hypothetical protein
MNKVVEVIIILMICLTNSLVVVSMGLNMEVMVISVDKNMNVSLRIQK